MAKVPVKVSERLIKTIPVFKKIISDAQSRDVNESDTVTIITGVLSEVFGFTKYSEITGVREQSSLRYLKRALTTPFILLT